MSNNLYSFQNTGKGILAIALNLVAILELLKKAPFQFNPKTKETLKTKKVVLTETAGENPRFPKVYVPIGNGLELQLCIRQDTEWKEKVEAPTSPTTLSDEDYKEFLAFKKFKDSQKGKKA